MVGKLCLIIHSVILLYIIIFSKEGGQQKKGGLQKKGGQQKSGHAQQKNWVQHIFKGRRPFFFKFHVQFLI